MVGRKWLWLGLGLPVALAAVITAGVWLIRSKPGAPETPLVAVPLTSEPGLVSHPSFSPDGNQVVYFRIHRDGDDHALYVKIIGVAGDPRRLTTQPGFDVSPTWSPDGRYIAFSQIERLSRWESHTAADSAHRQSGTDAGGSIDTRRSLSPNVAGSVLSVVPRWTLAGHGGSQLTGGTLRTVSGIRRHPREAEAHHAPTG